ncbi:MAG: tetratricopeptide repeat protein [Candidatus Sedimenticola endophacoides]
MPLGWIARHPVLLAIALFLVVGVLYRQVLFPAVPASDPDTQPEIVAAVPHAQPEGPPASGKADALNALETGGVESVREVTPARWPQDTRETPLVEAKPWVSAPVAGAVAPESSAYVFRPRQPTAPATLPDAFDAAIQKARQAYWSGDETQAVARYEAVIQRYPERPGPHGELGNIYFKQGLVERAAAEYQQALLLLADSGDRSAARALQATLEPLLPGLLRTPRQVGGEETGEHTPDNTITNPLTDRGGSTE